MPDRDSSEVVQLDGATQRDLLDQASEKIHDYVVFLSAMCRSGEVNPAGTATLVSYSGSHFLLTAEHVWSTLRRNAAGIGIPLLQEVGLYWIPRDFVAPITTGKRASDAWGPDLALLQLGPPAIAAMGARRSFLNLEKQAALATAQIDDSVSLWFFTGAPAEFAEYAAADGAEVGVLSVGSRIKERHSPGDHDYIDVELGERGDRVLPSSYRGVSGGPLWRVERRFTEGKNGVRLAATPTLHGVAFFESVDPKTGAGFVRCHGEHSLYDVLLGKV